MEMQSANILKLICILAIFNYALAVDSKLVNIALKTNWAYTPLNQEISEYIAHESKDLFWSFLDSLETTSDSATEREKYEEAFRVASTLLSPVQLSLLEYAIRIRYYSPSVQVHRQLLETLLESKDEIRNQAHSCSAFAYYNGKIYCTVKELLENVDGFSSVKSDETYQIDYRYASSTTDAPNVILHATIGTASFKSFHDAMKELASKGKLNYIFRHLVPPSDEKLTLGGYGIELALKNLEYKTVDDSKVEANTAKPSTAIEENEDEINGILFGTLQKRKPQLASDLASFKAFLLSNEEQFEELKVWELKDLGYQAAQRIISSTNPLRLLRDISQNFPTHATSLSKVKVNETLKQQIKDNAFVEPGRNLVLINGRSINPDTIEPFSLYSILQEEIEKLESLMRVGIPKSDAFRLLSLPPEQREDSVFKVNDNSIHFINDLKKDGQYSQWRSGVYEIFQRVWPGSFRYVAENFFTVVLIVDPRDPNSSYLLTVLMSMIQQNFPVRFGVIFVTQDTTAYAKKLASGDDSLEINEGVEYARAFIYLKEKFGGRAAIQLAQIYSTLASENTRDKLISSLDHVARQNRGSVDAAKVIASHDYDDVIKENAKFTVRNGFNKSPLAFMNGVPLNTQSNRDLYQDVINKYFELTGKIQNMVRMGEIRDGQDVYGTLMSKNNVLERFSPIVLPSDSKPLSFMNLAPASSKHLDAIRSIQYYGNSLDSIKYVSHVIVVDLNKKESQELALEAIKSLALAGDDTRVGILHNSEESNDLISRAIVASFKEQISTKSRAFATKLLGELISGDGSPKTEEWVFKIAEETLNAEKFKRNFRENSISDVLNLQRHLARNYFTVKPSQSVVITNGRVIDVTGSLFVADDFKFLATYEGNQRINKLKLHFGGIPFTVDTESQTPNFVSDAFMTIISLLGLDEIKGLEKFMIPAKSSFTLQKPDSSETFVITAILDPLSLASQRISTMLEVLVKSFDLQLQVILNPQEHSGLPLKNFYSYVLTQDIEFDQKGRAILPTATFSHLPLKRLLTLNLDLPESWLVTPIIAAYDMDNIKLESMPKEEKVMYAEFQLQHIVLQGNCLDVTSDPNPPRGLEVVLATQAKPHITDTIVMSNFGYFQLKANPGLWKITLKKESRSSELYDVLSDSERTLEEEVLITDFSTKFQQLKVTKKPGKEGDQLLVDGAEAPHTPDQGIWNSLTGNFFNSNGVNVAQTSNETIHVFSLASGHLYERFLKIMMLTVVKNTRNPVKFWLLANFLSPKFKDFIPQMAQKYGFQYELVTYKWPGWLNKQTEKQRIIWGYKILFLDVLFPLDLKKVVYVDADQVVRADLKELWEMDLHGAPYAYTPFCEDNHATDGFRFWKQGFWQNHLQGLPYHISALYLVDLQKFRRIAAGDQLRATYDSLSRDPNSLANLDQDLPNYMQHYLKIHSLPQEWLWCETWCSQDSKTKAKTIDLCNNPLTKTPKLDNALKIIPDWTDLDNEVKSVEAQVKNRG